MTEQAQRQATPEMLERACEQFRKVGLKAH